MGIMLRMHTLPAGFIAPCLAALLSRRPTEPVYSFELVAGQFLHVCLYVTPDKVWVHD